MANLMLRCEICMFARKRERTERFECRRNPPTAMPEDVADTGLWPYVDDDDWCGHFNQNLPPENESHKIDAMFVDDIEDADVGDLCQTRNDGIYVFGLDGVWRKTKSET